ncbi:DUF6429 family protein [Sporosarcina cascadiensis]|uniref:DUF6429 family protein n=1 Tax=Sporosarcina cascadiensis TaxID=2660747 RepID=UPI00129A7BCF|nr:DUF6429 family protein [Sporosarcina cascadiensis]
MDKQIDELVLLLLYLTSWEEDELPDGMKRSWKGYPFGSLDDLQAEDMIRGSNRSKSVYLTKTGIEKAESLLEKFHFDQMK